VGADPGRGRGACGFAKCGFGADGFAKCGFGADGFAACGLVVCGFGPRALASGGGISALAAPARPSMRSTRTWGARGSVSAAASA
jgi:hypothetical protein